MLWRNNGNSSFGIDLASSDECGPGCTGFRPRWRCVSLGFAQFRPISPKFAEIRRISPKCAEAQETIRRNSYEIHTKFDEILSELTSIVELRPLTLRRTFAEIRRNSPKFAETCPARKRAGLRFRRNSKKFDGFRRNPPKPGNDSPKFVRNSYGIRPNCCRNGHHMFKFAEIRRNPPELLMQ